MNSDCSNAIDQKSFSEKAMVQKWRSNRLKALNDCISLLQLFEINKITVLKECLLNCYSCKCSNSNVRNANVGTNLRQTNLKVKIFSYMNGRKEIVERKKETASGLSARGSLGAPFGLKPSLILSFSIVGHYNLRLWLRLLIPLLVITTSGSCSGF